MFNFFKKKNDNKKLVAYAKGKFIPITDVPDPIFSEKMMGDGVAILVKGDTIYAPCDAKVAMVATTFHAVGLNLADGTELLIHIGLETVNLNGKYFHVQVQAGQQVKAGDLLVTFEMNRLKEEGYDASVMLIGSDMKGKKLEKEVVGNISVGEKIAQLI